jgi:hypothetical protein
MGYAAFLVQLYAYCWFGGELTRLVRNLKHHISNGVHAQIEGKLSADLQLYESLIIYFNREFTSECFLFESSVLILVADTIIACEMSIIVMNLVELLLVFLLLSDVQQVRHADLTLILNFCDIHRFKIFMAYTHTHTHTHTYIYIYGFSKFMATPPHTVLYIHIYTDIHIITMIV